MNIPSSRALVPLSSVADTAVDPKDAPCSSGMGNRRKWLLALSAVLAIAALALGSVWLGFAAILPFLYVLPCLLMLAICMRHGSSSKQS